MFTWFSFLSPLTQALLATLFTWSVTALGASCVFFCRQINPRLSCAMLGFSGGVMAAASCWSLLIPAMEQAQALRQSALVVTATGFLAGGALIPLSDALFSGKTSRCGRLLLFSITLHNVPEGLCVGVAFAALTHAVSPSALEGACLLALGIGVQNFPEGAAVSLPLREEGLSRPRAFFWGQLSAAVEPVAGVLGAIAALHVRQLLPFLLAFAAGAMTAVVFQELTPESQRQGSRTLSTLASLIGFALMMSLDAAFS